MQHSEGRGDTAPRRPLQHRASAKPGRAVVECPDMTIAVVVMPSQAESPYAHEVLT